MPSCVGFGAGLTGRGTGLAAGLGGAGFGLVCAGVVCAGLVCAGLVCDADTRGAAVVIVVAVAATTVATASSRSDFMVITERYPRVHLLPATRALWSTISGGGRGEREIWKESRGRK